MAKTVYDPEQKAEALAIYVAEGVAAAAEKTGIPKGTIAAWAHRTGTQTEFTPEKAAEAVAMARVSIQKRKAALAEKLLEVAELGVAVEVEILQSRGAGLRDVVGARTRAIHDLQLLDGGPTARAEHAGLREEVIADARGNALRLVG